MVDAAGADKIRDLISTLEIGKDDLVQELGWDEDADSSISEAIEAHIGEELLDEDTDELCDTVLMWWRDEDGDLVDGLVDALRSLADNGQIWLLTPGTGREGALGPGVIPESAQLAGLTQTKAERLGDWQASCLVQRGTIR
ncbi:Protein of uncharacterised function (DUF3052) [Corynebacterium renale]|uniref:DUF3052 family protein n=1 Tax=Corynebacterium renale TaxID=1724 RepID=A0A2A9DQT5_9CORY|nr:Protein of unknown function (DUF3052) [Corynebacterium renale]SQG65074.1 Protein of uncharacterised function (DUF3052) [Corynebacterium renale]SQI18965.1 Protein of uncharacterised function (DUF3052) [Corynebacterium renale]STC97349.1 Protein of uncharacterised function (DUF3052) [Corynebacterium renale]